jgi:hypothetical protein
MEIPSGSIGRRDLWRRATIESIGFGSFPLRPFDP